jgi:hypothetical protein
MILIGDDEVYIEVLVDSEEVLVDMDEELAGSKEVEVLLSKNEDLILAIKDNIILSEMVEKEIPEIPTVPTVPTILEVIIQEEEKEKEKEKEEKEKENIIISPIELNNLSENLIHPPPYYLLNEIVHLISIKLVLGNISLCQYTFKIIVKIIIETIESYMDVEVHKDKKKYFAVKTMESLIKKMRESNDKEFFNTMIINGVFESIVDMIVDSSKGKLEINKSVKKTTGIVKFKSYFSNCVDFLFHNKA